MIQGGNLIEDAAETPDVTLLVIRFFLADLRRKVVGRADGSIGAIVGMLEDSGYAKVADLDISLGGEEDVLSLQVAMEDLLIMDVVHGKCHLDQPGHDLMLWEERP